MEVYKEIVSIARKMSLNHQLSERFQTSSPIGDNVILLFYTKIKEIFYNFLGKSWEKWQLDAVDTY